MRSVAGHGRCRLFDVGFGARRSRAERGDSGQDIGKDGETFGVGIYRHGE